MMQIANIGQFEVLQAAQNARIGMPSGMAVFNGGAPISVENTLQGKEIDTIERQSRGCVMALDKVINNPTIMDSPKQRAFLKANAENEVNTFMSKARKGLAECEKAINEAEPKRLPYLQDQYNRVNIAIKAVEEKYAEAGLG